MASITRGIDHIGITVPDVEEATTFFKNAFDAKIAYDGISLDGEPLKGVDVEQKLGVRPGTEVIHVRMLTFDNGAIELFNYQNTEQKEAVIASDIGIQHFCFYVDNMQQAVQRFIDAGGVLLTDPGSMQGDVENGSGEFVYGRLPWGTLIELTSYDEEKIKYPSDSEARRFTP